MENEIEVNGVKYIKASSFGAIDDPSSVSDIDIMVMVMVMAMALAMALLDINNGRRQ